MLSVVPLIVLGTVNPVVSCDKKVLWGERDFLFSINCESVMHVYMSDSSQVLSWIGFVIQLHTLLLDLLHTETTNRYSSFNMQTHWMWTDSFCWMTLLAAISAKCLQNVPRLVPWSIGNPAVLSSFWWYHHLELYPYLYIVFIQEWSVYCKGRCSFSTWPWGRGRKGRGIY